MTFALSRSGNGSELLHQAEQIVVVPHLGHAAIADAEELQPVDDGVLSGRWHAGEIAPVRDVMGVPGHDERDFAFAKKYGLPIKQVIDVEGRPYSTDAWQPWYADHGRCIHSGKYDGLAYHEAVDAIAVDLKAKGQGDKQV